MGEVPAAEDAANTEVQPATQAAPPSLSFPSLSRGESLATPEQALQVFEARRSWGFAVGLAGLSAFACILIFLIGGDPISQKVHAVGLVLMAMVALSFALTTRHVSEYRLWKIRTVAFVSIFTNASGYYYWGVFSAYAMVVTLSAYAFTSGAGRKTTRGVLSLSVLTHFGLGAAQLTGWVAPRGLVAPIDVSTTWQWVILVVLNLVLVGAVYAGIDAYASLKAVFDAHHAAQRDLAQKDAQLAEAHAEVRDARKPGEGRHSGEQLGRFKLAEVLGRGAMGEVYAATDERGARCAVKVLALHLHDNDDAVARFHREAKAIAGIASPNIVALIDVAPPNAVPPYLAMERLDGRDLGALLKEQPILEAGSVVAIVRAVAAGLDAAHAAGVIHRDLKPANIFAANSKDQVTWKILDFGVSKLLAADATMTAGHLVGTPGYMAPEQARGDELDRRADVYALGVVAYRLLTGRPAVVPGDVAAMIHDVVYRMPPPPSQLAQVTPAVEAVLALALAKDPEDRFATAGDLAAALAEATAGVLSPMIAERSASLLKKQPWGPWQRRASSRAKTAAI